MKCTSGFVASSFEGALLNPNLFDRSFNILKECQATACWRSWTKFWDAISGLESLLEKVHDTALESKTFQNDQLKQVSLLTTHILSFKFKSKLKEVVWGGQIIVNCPTQLTFIFMVLYLTKLAGWQMGEVWQRAFKKKKTFLPYACDDQKCML